MVVHPLDPTVRYARTDVGNAYRWSNSTQQWYPMRVSNASGSGVQSVPETDARSSYGEDSIAVDPTNTSIVYMVFPTEHSTMRERKQRWWRWREHEPGDFDTDSLRHWNGIDHRD
jgi:hypothetical protein